MTLCLVILFFNGLYLDDKLENQVSQLRLGQAVHTDVLNLLLKGMHEMNEHIKGLQTHIPDPDPRRPLPFNRGIHRDTPERSI